MTLFPTLTKPYPRKFHQWHIAPLDVRPPGGEDLVSLATRVLEATDEIIRRHPHQTVAIVAHEFPLAIVRCRAAGLELGRIREMVPPTGTWQQIVWNGALT